MPSDANPGAGPQPAESDGKRSKAADAARGPRIPKGLLLVLFLGAIIIAIISFATDSSRAYEAMSFADFQKHWDPQKQAYVGFDQAELNDDVLLVRPIETQATEPATTPGDDEKNWTDAFTKRPVRKWYRIRVPTTMLQYDFLKQLATIPDFKYEPTSRIVSALIVPIIWLACLAALFYLLFVRPLRGQGPGNVLAFGRSRPKLIAKEQTKVRFEDVAGIEEAKEEVAEVIEFLKNPRKFERLGGRIPRGLLFVGPPGTGKTLLAKAIAGEAEVPFYSISGSDFVEMFVGVGASRVRDLFRQAKENAPCIIFLDEVDAVGRRRGSGLGGGHDEREQTLNAILVEMDGFDTNEQVIVIAATNRPDVLDPALLRPGRFDREIVISLPDVKGRLEILKVHARHVKMADNVDLVQIARGTPMFSGADLEALINEAAIRATMAGKDSVTQADLEEARDKVRFGRERRSRVLDEREREVTAYHEAGHAMIMRLCPDAEPLHKVTIIPRGMALGSTMMLPEKDRYTFTRRDLLAQIKVLFGGRIAEATFCHDITSGAANDIERATEIARRMVCDFGMSDELGPIRYASKEQQVFLGGEIVQPREYSEATAEQIDRTVRKIIDDCYREAEAMLLSHKEETALVAQALLRHETLTAHEITQILEAGDINVISKNGDAAKGATSGTAASSNPAPVQDS